MLGAVLTAAGLGTSLAQVAVSDTKRGTATFVPYYTVTQPGPGSEWRTLINITNTEDTTLAVKVRLHEQFNSRDVLDFVVLLSPHDVWSGVITRGPDGLPRVTTPDRSCTVPISIRDNSFEQGGGFLLAGVEGINTVLSVVDTVLPGALGNILDLTGLLGLLEPNFTGSIGSTDSYDGDPARASEGYVEVLVMGEQEDIIAPLIPPLLPGLLGFEPLVDFGDLLLNQLLFIVGVNMGNIAYYVEHDPSPVNNLPRVVTDEDGNTFLRPADRREGDPRNCYLVEQAFEPQVSFAGGTEDIPGSEGSGSPAARAGFFGLPLFGFGDISSPAPLSTNVSYVNPSRGIGGAIEATHYEGFGVGENLVTAKAFPYDREPTLASHAGLWTTTGLFAPNGVNDGVARSRFANEWSSNPRTGAGTDFIVSFPTKRFQADEDPENVDAGCSGWRNVNSGGGVYAVDACPDLGFPTVFDEANATFGAPMRISYDIYDREENVEVRYTDPSPGRPDIPQLRYEVNVIPVGPLGTQSVFATLSPQPVLTDKLPGAPVNGWIEGTFLDPNGVEVEHALTGFIFKLRDFGTAGANFGQTALHRFNR
ncbi:hypothetical protein [Algiphilus sp.]|uniref:hypothetical protein n=1 Tax=Algiphilus sp. TaxID=1872431 RepID=UPI0032ED2FEE